MKRTHAPDIETARKRARFFQTSQVVYTPTPLNTIQKKQVNRMINSREEYKTFLKGQVAQAMPLTAVITSLSDISQGVTDNNRVGNHIHLKTLKGTLTCLAADSTNIMRVIIFKWKENDTYNPPTLAQILAVGPSGGPDFYSSYAPENPGNYVILKDYQLVGCNGSSASNLIQIRKFSIKLSGKVQYFSDGGTSGTNKIFIMWFSDSSAVTHPAISYNTELSFSDS